MQADLSRRSFLAATGSAAAIAAMPRVSSAAPSDRIVMGMIGVGTQGTGRLREFLNHDDVRIGAICDVDRRHLDRAVALVEKEKGYKPQAFDDFRRLLESKEIDAVAIVTPDHWHAIPTVNAFEAGKDVFVEKPLSYSVAEGRAMADASLNHKRVTQMGNHIHNTTGNYRRVVEMVRSGKLGKITRVHLWKTSPTQNFRVREPAALPEGFNYDFWLGPAPKHAYTPLRSHGTFRQFWDYSGGTFIDFWCHISDVAFWALDLKAPKSIYAAGGRFFLTDETEAADTMEAILEFPNLLYIYSFRPTPLPGFEHMGHIGCLFEGTEASLVANYEDHEVWVKGKKMADFPKPPQSIPDSPGHIREFLDAIKSRNLETTCNLRYGHHLSKFGLLSNISYRTGRRIEWDEQQERIIGDKQASRYLARTFRKPWKLKTQPRPARQA
ncbi:MAG: Inositol 2-dehydrogenase/D-chiro-inositol 3-dehydrogenase [Bryobacteraceae bacterium]|nr:Inositol 2-dehydrogenase/D-chiro-inositol 3-dehydrogenase [Bryobacteraceae bacterium]